jgi:hypothetical protein
MERIAPMLLARCYAATKFRSPSPTVTGGATVSARIQGGLVRQWGSFMRASRTGQRCTRLKLCHHTTSLVFFDCLNLATPQVWVIERHELVRVENAVDSSGFGAGLIATQSSGRTLTVLAPYHTRPSTERYQQPERIPWSIESSPRHVHLLTRLMRPNASPKR